MHRKIESIIICCFKRDIHLLRICIASVRYWYPAIPIFLLKDETSGSFSTCEMENNWDVGVLQTDYKGGGWGLTKLESLFLSSQSKILLLDSDTVFLGPIIDYLDQFEEDFIVTGVQSDDPEYYLISRDYISVDKVKKTFDKNYIYPGYGFNSGQVVLTRGIFERSDFIKLVDFSDEGFVALAPIGLFPYADQGIFNYALAKKQQSGLCTVRYDDFWYWSGLEEVNDLSLEKIKGKEGYNKIIHWAGTKSHFLNKMHRADILFFYENFYYKIFFFGSALKIVHHCFRFIRLAVSKYVRKLTYFFSNNSWR